MRLINIFLIFSLAVSSCSPVFRYRDKEDLSQKLNWQASKNRLELILQNGRRLKLAKVEMLADSLYYQLMDSLIYQSVAYEEIRYLRFKNYEKSVFWGTAIGLSLGILQWDAIASSYEGGSAKVEVPLIITGMYIFLGALIGSVIGIPQKVTPESILKITNKN
jgi:hypothetical protein